MHSPSKLGSASDIEDSDEDCERQRAGARTFNQSKHVHSARYPKKRNRKGYTWEEQRDVSMRDAHPHPRRR
jgi:ribosomal protein L37E